MTTERRSCWMAALLIGGLASLSSLGPAWAQTAPGDALHVRPVDVLDSGMVALRGLIPVDWQAQGGIVWNDYCVIFGYNVRWGASTPDGSHGIAFLPGLAWYAEDRYGCQQAPVTSLMDLLTLQARLLSPQARIIDFRQRPDIVGGLAVPHDMPELGLQGVGLNMVTWIDAGEVLVAYTDAQGRDMRAVILGSGMFSSTTVSFNYDGMVTGIPDRQFYQGESEFGFAAWAPAGTLDLTRTEALRRSFLPQPDWSRAIAEHRAKIVAGMAATAGRIAEINRQSNAEVSAIIASTYDAAQASNDRSYRETMETVRGVETYVDTSGQNVQLDNSYRQAWQLADGSYVLTNDAFYNPVAVHGVTGTQLNAAP